MLYIRDLIRKKRKKEELTTEELDFFVDSYYNNSILPEQISALVTLMYVNGLSYREISYLAEKISQTGKIQDLFKNKNDTSNLLRFTQTCNHSTKDNNLIDNDEALNYINKFIKLENTFENNNNTYSINKHKYLYVCSINCSNNKIIFCSKDTYTILKNNIDYLYFILEKLKNDLNVHYDKNIIETFGNKNLIDEFKNIIDNNKNYYNELSTFINIFLNSPIFVIDL